MTANLGYIAFLASWLARHKPIQVALAALLLAAGQGPLADRRDRIG
jgi:general nucleoside transport system permease protein